MFEITVLTNKEKNEYEDFLKKCEWSLVQHSTEWRNVILDLEKDESFFIVAKENDKIVGVLPLYYYKCKFGNVLTTIAWYTISGIICSRGAYCKEIYKALLDYSLTIAKELDCTAISIASNPFLDDKEYYLEYFKPDYTMENFIQYINLNEVFDEKGNLIHPNYIRRSSITRNLKKAKLQPIIISDEQTQNNVDEWFRIHEKRMKELSSTPISKRLFDSSLKNLIPNRKGKFLFAFYQGKMISGCLFIYNKRTMNVYMMSMNTEYNKLGVNYLITYQMLKWANLNGISIFNWMSSSKKSNGVYKWKEQWGSHERTFLYLTKILGDISPWKNMAYNELEKIYKFHYLLPFNLLKYDNLKFTTKDELTSFMQSVRKIL